jgi:hypothetical protein
MRTWWARASGTLIAPKLAKADCRSPPGRRERNQLRACPGGAPGAAARRIACNPLTINLMTTDKGILQKMNHTTQDASLSSNEFPAKPKYNTLTGVRKILCDAAIAKEYTLAHLSRAIGHNQAYLHQYLFKKTPKRLDEDSRRILAELLDLDESDLRAPGSLMPKPHAPVTAAAPAAPGAQSVPEIPVYREGATIDGKSAARWIAPIAVGQMSASFAVWIDVPRSRLAPGDIAIVQDNHPARPGDQVVVLKGDRLNCIGELACVTAADFSVTDNEVSRSFDRSEARLLKIVGLLLA